MRSVFINRAAVLFGCLFVFQCLTLTFAQADIGRICINSATGALRVAFHCSASETWLNNVGSLRGPAGPVGPQGPEGRTLSLYDAEDQRIGLISSVGCKLFHDTYGKPFNAVAVLLENSGSLYPVCAERQGFFSTIMPVFSSLDCTGPAYVYDNQPSDFPPSADSLFSAGAIARNGDRRTLYRPDYETGRQFIKVNSFLHLGGICATPAGGYMAAVLPMIEVADVSAMYRTPFSVR